MKNNHQTNNNKVFSLFCSGWRNTKNDDDNDDTDYNYHYEIINERRKTFQNLYFVNRISFWLILFVFNRIKAKQASKQASSRYIFQAKTPLIHHLQVIDNDVMIFFKSYILKKTFIFLKFKINFCFLFFTNVRFNHRYSSVKYVSYIIQTSHSWSSSFIIIIEWMKEWKNFIQFCIEKFFDFLVYFFIENFQFFWSKIKIKKPSNQINWMPKPKPKNQKWHSFR